MLRLYFIIFFSRFTPLPSTRFIGGRSSTSCFTRAGSLTTDPGPGAGEYKKVLVSVSNEREITVRINELLRYRKNRINNLQESESYKAERIKRNTGKADRKKALEAGLPKPVRIKGLND